MKTWTAPDQVPAGLRSVVTIGNFDGLHNGHSRVIGSCVDRARKLNCLSVGLTFDPHPRAVHSPGTPLPLLMSVAERVEALTATGLDAVFVAQYGPALYNLSPEAFVQQYLVDCLGVVEIVVGEDFRFGSGNSGNIDTLRSLGRLYGFEVAMVTDIQAPSGRRWSSSWVRELLEVGDVEQAAWVLGRFHRLTGIVQHGEKRGRTLGFPTANLDAGQELMVPADGVYAGWLVLDARGGQEFLPSAISVGSNPQFAGQKRTVETHVLGRSDLDLYGQQVTVVFVKRLRPMLTFNSVNDLTRQMDEDLRATAQTLGVRTASRVDPAAVTAGQ